MNLDQMQDLMNDLEAYFKVFVYPSGVGLYSRDERKKIILRIFHERDDDFTDISFDMQGHLLEDEEKDKEMPKGED